MAMENEKMPVIVVGVDESAHSDRALQWTLQRFFSDTSNTTNKPQQRWKLVVVHVRPYATSIINVAGAGSADVLPFVDSGLNETVTRVVNNVRQICIGKGVSVVIEVIDGDARFSLCNAVDRHQAEVLVVGSHGYGAFKRAIHGSVSDYCSHHAHCNVMVVKKPKQPKQRKN
ncbi:Universal stress protein [Zostera marina]|uniref:Universal stress protein n=1 Tax=Zostera marina TaxID=29655 RepID=A0A0K9PBV8_ZOSMR|nr:Universal stress protein [Zostera marina]